MRVLALTPHAPSLVRLFRENGDEPTFALECTADLAGFDFLVSFGCRQILTPDQIAPFSGRTANVHIALLPWNRGADPNFWSWLDRTPKGVSIHVITKGLDTGPLLAQEAVDFADGHTLRTSYDLLMEAAFALFRSAWSEIRKGAIVPMPQPAGGSYHRTADKQPIMAALPHGYDTPVAELEALGARRAANFA